MNAVEIAVYMLTVAMKSPGMLDAVFLFCQDGKMESFGTLLEIAAT